MNPTHSSRTNNPKGSTIDLREVLKSMQFAGLLVTFLLVSQVTFANLQLTANVTSDPKTVPKIDDEQASNPGTQDMPVPSTNDPFPPPPFDDRSPPPITDDNSDNEWRNDPPLPIPPGGERESQTLVEEEIELPVFGIVSARKLGMPVFTITIGLVDGFNPCAMWVLLFLLSLLVNLKSRLKMFAIASIFVLISGIAYFAFMAAWLNVFLFIGYLRAVQVVLGIVSVAIGGIHIKDFFAPKRGISLSIPESAKPSIYRRVRKILSAETLWAALLGATVLAILVNVVELLCTAGLPALYTKVLTMQGYPQWMNYLYLALYNIAYVFDDSVMIIIAVITLGKRKLQEKEGRWLKLISGLLILTLGILMIFKPDWLY